MTRASASEAGFLNYTTKRNWRRDLSDEMTREGYDYCVPDPDAGDASSQPFPAASDQTINLVHLSRRPNGDAAMLVATPTTIYRFNSSLAGYYEDPDYENYVDPADPDLGGQPYFAVPSRWQVIGSGFSPNGRRWEAKNVNGLTILNNSVDLPVSYRLDYSTVTPMHELREQGILSVGTIEEYDSILMGGDVDEMLEGNIPDILEVASSGSITVSQTGRASSGVITATTSGAGPTYTITATASIFTAPMVGRMIRFSNGARFTITGYTSGTVVSATRNGTYAVITAKPFVITDAWDPTSSTVDAYSLTASSSFFTSAMVGKLIAWADGTVRKVTKYVSGTHAKTDYDAPISAGEVKYDNPNAYLSKETLIANGVITDTNRRQTRLLWSEVGAPTKFGTQSPVSMESGSEYAIASRTIGSLSIGDAVAVDGAGLFGGVLILDDDGNPVTVKRIVPGFIELSAPAKTTTSSGTIQTASSIGSIVGYEDLDDDGSGILKMLKLREQVVIYKDTSIFIGQYTGNVDQPFLFKLIPIPHGQALHYRNTVVNINGLYHLYAGRNAFYSFDLTNQVPQPVLGADLISNLFYDHATIENTESIFVADNHNTKEVWFVNPQNSTDPVMCFDHRYGTWSTCNIPLTAGGMIKSPMSEIPAETEDWFVMGNAAGTVLIYGNSTSEVAFWGDGVKEIYYRRSARPYSITKSTYTATLASGLADFGNAYDQKHIRSYVLQFSSLKPGPASIQATFQTFRNENLSAAQTSTKTISDPGGHGLVPMHFLFNYFKDTLTLTVNSAQTRIHTRIYDVYGIRDASHNRQ